MKKHVLLPLLMLFLVAASGCTVSGAGNGSSGSRETYPGYRSSGGHGGHSH